MDKDLEIKLKATLKKLEVAYIELKKTQGYNQETENVKLLQEMISEQVMESVKYENTHNTAC
ncbi:MAG TPA: hypothetical protein PLJ21_12145 [Pseudobdellovibrionaceae bacterium]|mgnify:CR=1 FL=1|nr:hypothetical protein [Pseudobdellovibrionaceae bacterium]